MSIAVTIRYDNYYIPWLAIPSNDLYLYLDSLKYYLCLFKER